MNPQQSYYCYILWSTVGQKFYIGVTENVVTRLAQHNAGISRWTKRYTGSWSLVWQHQFESLGDARKFENLLKSQKGGAGFWKLTQLSPAEFARGS